MNDNKLTLKEEIEIEACLFEDGCHNHSVQYHFLEGAECMRKLLIEMAYKWIKKYNEETLPYTDLDCDGNSYVNMENFAEEFRKAMEE